MRNNLKMSSICCEKVLCGVEYASHVLGNFDAVHTTPLLVHENQIFSYSLFCHSSC